MQQPRFRMRSHATLTFTRKRGSSPNDMCTFQSAYRFSQGPEPGQTTLAAAQSKDKTIDEDEIRTHAGRAHWISSPTP